MPNVNLTCFLMSYLVAFGLDVARLRSKLAWSRWVAILFGGAGLLAQTLYLLLRSSQTQQPPLLSSAHDWLLVLAWLAVLTHLFVSLLDATIASGLVVWPIVLALSLPAPPLRAPARPRRGHAQSRRYADRERHAARLDQPVRRALPFPRRRHRRR